MEVPERVPAVRHATRSVIRKKKVEEFTAYPCATWMVDDDCFDDDSDNKVGAEQPNDAGVPTLQHHKLKAMRC
jgi:hypothetical protein